MVVAPVALALMFAGTPLITGGVVSLTTTLNDVGDGVEFPLASLAVQLTGVTPIENVDPDAGKQLSVGFGSTRSETATNPE